jgi:hypothetical protein
MKIKIAITFSNGSCECGPTRTSLVIDNGTVVEDTASGMCRWQCGKASESRPYGQYICNIQKLVELSTRQSATKLEIASLASGVDACKHPVHFTDWEECWDLLVRHGVEFPKFRGCAGSVCYRCGEYLKQHPEFAGELKLSRFWEDAIEIS